jgi:hypothetical protein
MVVHKIDQARLLARNQNRAQAERRTEKHACLSHAYSMPHMFFFVKRARNARRVQNGRACISESCLFFRKIRITANF